VTDPADAERYRLPEDENRRVFQEEIVPQLLAGRARQQTPTVVFLVGQPGAGKSRLTEVLAARLNQRGGFVDIDSDLYKPYHPDYDALMARDDTLMAAFTRADGRAWMARAEDYVRTHGLHVIVQETSQNAEAVAEKMSAYRGAGAHVEALFLAVPQAMSNQGIIAWYFEQLTDRGHGRLTVQANADESYLGILALADRIDREPLVDVAGVYRRGEPAPRYSNSLDDAGAWTSPPGLRRALEAERARPWTASETDSFLTTQHRLRQVGDQLGPGWTTRLERIDEQAAALLTTRVERGEHRDADQANEVVTVEAEHGRTPEIDDRTAPTALATTAQRAVEDPARRDPAAPSIHTPSPRAVVGCGPQTEADDVELEEHGWAPQPTAPVLPPEAPQAVDPAPRPASAPEPEPEPEPEPPKSDVDDQLAAGERAAAAELHGAAAAAATRAEVTFTPPTVPVAPVRAAAPAGAHTRRGPAPRPTHTPSIAPDPRRAR